ncbi:hypothetical protein [Actinokineospora inagensis]|uniref:hypothetical protein n=1 Tax=Actinokineospora inagensis TaxID=103730 RepID=UPI0003FA8774|nr:hypothetical protein [Actinokineospora inagensis]
MNTTNADELALVACPELNQLIMLREADWQFLPEMDGERVVGINGLRIWPQNWTDLVTVKYVTDAAAVRSNPLGKLVWMREDTLVDVIDQLFALPAPDEPFAPRLAHRMRSPLWTP